MMEWIIATALALIVPLGSFLSREPTSRILEPSPGASILGVTRKSSYSSMAFRSMKRGTAMRLEKGKLGENVVAALLLFGGLLFFVLRFAVSISD